MLKTHTIIFCNRDQPYLLLIGSCLRVENRTSGQSEAAQGIVDMCRLFFDSNTIHNKLFSNIQNKLFKNMQNKTAPSVLQLETVTLSPLNCLLFIFSTLALFNCCILSICPIKWHFVSALLFLFYCCKMIVINVLKVSYLG